MRSELVLRSPSDGTGWEESWAVSGHDESMLRGYLAKLDRYLTPAPLERWEQSKRLIDADDRWLAAMLLSRRTYAVRASAVPSGAGLDGSRRAPVGSAP
jgi:hypothetical protein